MICFDRFLNTNPRVAYFPEFDSTGEYKGFDLKGIQAIAYDGADYKGQRTKVFAHIGFPENMTKPVPAVVLVHGGGGHPEDLWIKKWNAKGYGAIAMDTTGYFPTEPAPHLYGDFAATLKRELVAPFAEEGYTVGPYNSGMGDWMLPAGDQWMYQAVAAVILAHNILRNDPRVDPDRIGISGISWGGVITSITIGYDTRFAFAVPIYGCGYMGCGYADLSNRFRQPGVQKWFAEKRFSKVKMPVMWLSWNDDPNFSANISAMSYLDTKGNNPNTCLSLHHRMWHSHEYGYTPEESYWFDDEVLKGNRIPAVKADYSEGNVSYCCTGKIKRARLFYIDEKMTYIKRSKYSEVYADVELSFLKQDWQILDLPPTETAAELPGNAVGKYVEFTLENGIILTTPYAQ